MKKSAVYFLVIFATSAYADPIGNNGDEIVSTAEKCIESAKAISSIEEVIKCRPLLEKCIKTESTKCVYLMIKSSDAIEAIVERSSKRYDASKKRYDASKKALEESKRALEESKHRSKHRFCRTYATFAQVTMSNRQQGISMEDMMALPMKESGLSVDEQRKAESLVISAYKNPRYQTYEMQRRIIEDFRDEAYLSCIEESAP